MWKIQGPTNINPCPCTVFLGCHGNYSSLPKLDLFLAQKADPKTTSSGLPWQLAFQWVQPLGGGGRGFQQELRAQENRGGRVFFPFHSLLLCWASGSGWAPPYLLFFWKSLLYVSRSHWALVTLLPSSVARIGDVTPMVGPLSPLHMSENSPFDKFFSLEPSEYSFVSCCGPGLTHLSNPSFQQTQIPLNLGKI